MQAVVDAIHYAYDRKVVLVAAASDEDVEEQGSPANVLQPTGTGPDLQQGLGLVVTAADFSDARATFGSDASGQPLRPGRGTQISLAAYGAYGPSGPTGIFGAFPTGTTQIETGTVDPPSAPCVDCRTTFNGDNRYAYLAGTSMSTPQVAAAAALVRHLNPDLTIGQILTILKQSARRPAGSGWTPELGWGILDAGAALDAARRVDRPGADLAPARAAPLAPRGGAPALERIGPRARRAGRLGDRALRGLRGHRRANPPDRVARAGGRMRFRGRPGLGAIASTRSRSTPPATASCAPTARARAILRARR